MRYLLFWDIWSTDPGMLNLIQKIIRLYEHPVELQSWTKSWKMKQQTNPSPTSKSWMKPSGAVEQFTFRYWWPSEKFPGEHHVKLWDGTTLTRFAETVSSNIVLYSRFIWLNRSITLIRAETERYDIVHFLRGPLSLWLRDQAFRSQSK